MRDDDLDNDLNRSIALTTLRFLAENAMDDEVRLNAASYLLSSGTDIESALCAAADGVQQFEDRLSALETRVGKRRRIRS